MLMETLWVACYKRFSLFPEKREKAFIKNLNCLFNKIEAFFAVERKVKAICDDTKLVPSKVLHYLKE